MRKPITYRIQVWDKEEKLLADYHYTTKWTINKLSSFLRKKYKSWHRIEFKAEGSRDFYNAKMVD